MMGQYLSNISENTTLSIIYIYIYIYILQLNKGSLSWTWSPRERMRAHEGMAGPGVADHEREFWPAVAGLRVSLSSRVCVVLLLLLLTT
jgi:hypothetical protein